MSTNTASTTGSIALNALYSEAESLLKLAEQYRSMMEELKPEDPQRDVYAGIIRDLVNRSSKLSSIVYTTSTSAAKNT